MKLNKEIALVATLLLATSCSTFKNNFKPNNNVTKKDIQRIWSYEGYRNNILQSAEVPTEFSTPLYNGDNFIFGLQKRGIVATSRTGKEKWNLPIDKGADGTPVEVAGITYIGANDSNLYAIESQTGKIVWKVELSAPLTTKPLINENTIFVNLSNNTLEARELATGKWLWHYKKNVDKLTTIKGNSIPATDGKRVYTGFADGTLAALDINNGNLVWEKKIHKGGKFTDVDAEALIDGETIYIPSYDGALYAVKKSDGTILWRFDAGGARGVLIEDSRIYLSSSDTTLYCLNKENSKQIWKFLLPKTAIPTKGLFYKDYYVIGSSEDDILFINKGNGNLVKSINLGSGTGIYSNPIIDENKLYVLTNFGNLYAFSLNLK